MGNRNDGAVVIFNGQYNAVLGRYGTLVLPITFRERLAQRAGGQRKLVLVWAERLRIYPFGEATEAEGETLCWDAAGAMKLPQGMLERAGLCPGDGLAVVGVKDWIELWKREDWEAEEAGNFGFTREEIERMFQQLDE